MDAQPFLIVACSFAPPLILLFLTLDRYEGLFSMRRLTAFFTLGLAAGCVAAFVEVMLLFTWGLADNVVTAFLGYVVGMVLAEEMLKVVVFNYPKWTGRFQTMFDAVAFGAAFGSGFPLFFLSANAAEGGVIDWKTYASVTGLCAAFCLFHVGNAIVISRGSVEKDMWPWALKGVALRLPLNMMMLLWVFDIPLYYALIPAFPYGLAVWWKARDILDEAVPREAKRAVLKAKQDAKKSGD